MQISVLLKNLKFQQSKEILLNRYEIFSCAKWSISNDLLYIMPIDDRNNTENMWGIFDKIV